MTYEPGDWFFFISDGVTDAMNAENERFEDDRLLQTLRANLERSPNDILAALHEEIIRFCGQTNFADDLTCVAISTHRVSDSA